QGRLKRPVAVVLVVVLQVEEQPLVALDQVLQADLDSNRHLDLPGPLALLGGDQGRAAVDHDRADLLARAAPPPRAVELVGDEFAQGHPGGLQALDLAVDLLNRAGDRIGGWSHGFASSVTLVVSVRVKNSPREKMRRLASPSGTQNDVSSPSE